MTLLELQTNLKKIGISEDQYFLNGNYGSVDDNEKISLNLKKGIFINVYETYFKQGGEKHSVKIFYSEKKACEYIYKKLTDEQAYTRIQNIEGLTGMTVNERLYVSGLMDEFDRVKVKDKKRAKEILKWLKVDESSIELILK